MDLISHQAFGGATLSLADHDLLDDRDHRVADLAAPAPGPDAPERPALTGRAAVRGALRRSRSPLPIGLPVPWTWPARVSGAIGGASAHGHLAHRPAVDVGLNACHRIDIAKDVPPAIVERHVAISALRTKNLRILDFLHVDALLRL
jgi:hypothetical protein